ncbi:MAG: type II toxin-antitoxin system VapC family toxin [Gammaproteobacteria bacterium]|nr:type II toxin-antitoxin system VapC family toxin [Gammaproteobacteria bacterium]
MNVVDSSAWLCYFAGDGNAGAFAKAIEKSEELIVPSIVLTEVFKSLLRQCDEDIALEAIAHMEQGKVVALDSGIALDAGYYGVEYRLPLADSIIYATAKKYDAMLWTQDADFKLLDGVRYFPKK